MQRREFIMKSALTAGSIAIANSTLLAHFLADPWNVRMLSDEIGIFTEKGGTIAFLLSKEGVVVIDAQFPEQAKHLINELKNRTDKPINLLINTHHHGDHTAGNIEFKNIVQHVIGHENCLLNHQHVAEVQKTVDKQLFADITFRNTWKIKVGNEKIKAHYLGAAHTNGDAIIHFQNANIAHMGDLVFNRRYAFVDRAAGASISGWIDVLDKAKSIFDTGTLFVFGHAFDPVKVTGSMDDLSAMQHYLAKLLRFVDTEMRNGKTKEDILKTKSIPGVSEWQGDGIERGLQAAYEELTVS